MPAPEQQSSCWTAHGCTLWELACCLGCQLQDVAHLRDSSHSRIFAINPQIVHLRARQVSTLLCLQLVINLWMQLFFAIRQGIVGESNGEAIGFAGKAGSCTWMDEFWLRVYRMCRSLSMTMSRIGEGLCHILGTKPGRYADTPLDRSLCSQIKKHELASWHPPEV